MPSFRPALVSGGVLVLCRALLELFIAKVQACRIIKSYHSSNNVSCDYDCNSTSDNNGNGLCDDNDNDAEQNEERLMACKSISNISLTLMYTIGGVSMFNNFSAPYLNGAHDYTVTWIDHQVLSEDIPRAMVKLINCSLQEWAVNNFPSKKTGDVSAIDGPTCPFRHFVCMNLAKALFQLSSRAGNRPTLNKIGVPQALCMLFVYAAEEFEKMNVPKAEERVCVDDLINETRNFSITSKAEFDGCSRDQAVADRVFSTHAVCAALDALTFFLNDTKASETSTSLYNSIPLTFTLSLPKPPSFGSLPSEALDNNDSSSIWLETPLLTMVCYPSLIKSIKDVITTLPRCPARLACLRVILSLTQWPDSLHALFIGDITDALVLISAEAELHRVDNNRSQFNENTNQSRKMKDNERSCIFSIGGSTNAFTPYTNTTPTTNTASTTNSSSNSQKQEQSLSKSGGSNLMKSSSTNSISSNKSASDLVITRNESISVKSLKFNCDKVCSNNCLKEENKAALTTEETMTVCLALANISQSKDYAIRLFKNGLLNIMFGMVDSTHFEISRQAVRCVSALCTVISSVVDTRSCAKQRNTQVLI